MMSALTKPERICAEALASIGYCNPFLPERFELERRALGSAASQMGRSAGESRSTPFPTAVALDTNPAAFGDPDPYGIFERLGEQAQRLADKLRCCLLQGTLDPSEQEVYREVSLFLLYARYFSITKNPQALTQGISSEECSCRWEAFARDYEHYLHVPRLSLPAYFDAAHCFSVFFQIDRAFLNIFACIIGRSMAMSRLRAAVWESIFTHDMRRYVRGVYRSMGDITTLISGPSGTGKELVARAIGLSRYQAFEPRKQRFRGADQPPLLSLNLSALAETIIESELFGHRKGAFTGAVEDRAGWLEACPAEGCVFLDEIGELNEAIQIKLLRVMQIRQFARLGETKQRQFKGKFLAATNRELEAEIKTGRFRSDLYYRMCADLIQTPTLNEQLQESPEDLELLVHFVATRLLHAVPDEVEGLAAESIDWINDQLGADYAWPGNIRELEQCVRNVLIRKRPRSGLAALNDRANKIVKSNSSPGRLEMSSASPEMLAVMEGRMTLAEVEEWYTDSVYQRLGRYDLTARRLQINWRTVKDKVQRYAERHSKP